MPTESHKQCRAQVVKKKNTQNSLCRCRRCRKTKFDREVRMCYFIWLNERTMCAQQKKRTGICVHHEPCKTKFQRSNTHRTNYQQIIIIISVAHSLVHKWHMSQVSLLNHIHTEWKVCNWIKTKFQWKIQKKSWIRKLTTTIVTS